MKIKKKKFWNISFEHQLLVSVLFVTRIRQSWFFWILSVYACIVVPTYSPPHPFICSAVSRVFEINNVQLGAMTWFLRGSTCPEFLKRTISRAETWRTSTWSAIGKRSRYTEPNVPLLRYNNTTLTLRSSKTLNVPQNFFNYKHQINTGYWIAAVFSFRFRVLSIFEIAIFSISENSRLGLASLIVIDVVTTSVGNALNKFEPKVK